MAESDLQCANCGQPLDPADKFCRECGLPTLRRAEAQAQVPTLTPDTDELKRALSPTPEPRPFVREEVEPTAPASLPAEPLTTSDVVRATNPTFITNLASSTALMVGIIILLAVIGITLIVLAFRP
jgi:hypothetical protein